jgi:predicted TPR repeat methyltransferase
MQSHADAIRAAFTFQAEYISTSPAFLSQERLDRLLELAQVPSSAGAPLEQADMLELACGAGVMASFMAGYVRQVTGIDLTPAVLQKAVALAKEAGRANARFLLGDVTCLPFPDATFDLATCTAAFHHFDQPEQVLAEVARVLRPGGKFCAIDVTTSEMPREQETHQQMERLRDPSHTTNLTPSTWRQLVQKAGLEVTGMDIAPSHRDLEGWLTVCPEENKAQVRELFEQDISEGRSGLNVRRDGDLIMFTHPTLLLKAEKA